VGSITGRFLRALCCVRDIGRVAEARATGAEAAVEHLAPQADTAFPGSVLSGATDPSDRAVVAPVIRCPRLRE